MDLNSQQVHHDFHVLKNSLGLSETIIDNAKYVIRNASKEGLVRGRTHITIVAAAVYIACREAEAPRPLHDIAAIANVKQKILARYWRILMNNFYPHLPIIDPQLYVKLPAIDPFKCLIRLADMINANEKAKRLTALMMNEIVKRELSAGKNPMAVAASILYISCKKLVIVLVSIVSLKRQE